MPFSSRRSHKLLWLLLCTLGISACEDTLPANAGGSLSEPLTGSHALQSPARVLAGHDRLRFSVGHSFFRNPWVIAPSSTIARDGLGPLFNANSCIACHTNNGRGDLPGGKPMQANGLILRLSAARGPVSPLSGVAAHPILGSQLQTRALPGLRPEGQLQRSSTTLNKPLKNALPVTLQRHHYSISGNPSIAGEALLISPRLAPALIGAGLLDAIEEKDIARAADPDDRDGDGISGRVNRVWDRQARDNRIGRFGWKAGQPNLRQQVAAALHADIGITSTLFPESDCPGRILDCSSIPNGGRPEIDDKLLDEIVFYLSSLAVPEFRMQEKHRQGWQLFRQIGCDRCHTPEQQTGNHRHHWLAHQRIYPFTDLLLHDMGEELSDDRREFGASGREWRTPPLWGLGLTEVIATDTGYLHDGRARNLTEAILWHGGEAEQAATAFADLAPIERNALIQFLQSL